MNVRGLEQIDLHQVPLPVGTEVKTTTHRINPHTGRTIPRGAVGRVHSIRDGMVEVQLVGIGEILFKREELVPRKRGQLLFARARARAEQSLERCTILTATVGSRAWGLETEGSDFDTRGVLLFPFAWTTGLVPCPDVVVSSDGSHTRWELERTIHQALRADPNTLEMLFVPAIEVSTSIGEELLASREAFVSKKIYGSFGRYALAQAKKLEQALRLAEHRGLVLEWLRASPVLSLDELAERLAVEALNAPGVDGRLRAKQYLKQLYRSMYDQGLLERATFEALHSFATNHAVELELPRELRPKNAYNLLRIVCCAVQWLKTGEPLIRVDGALCDRLAAIKSGEVPLRQSLRWTEEEAAHLEEARAASRLPEHPDFVRAEGLLRKAREWAAQQWFDRTASAWGVEAPPPPALKLGGLEDE